ncbi:MAG: G5 domain-containing protein [Clostridia bacterium]|nr:G5 domain-containing protein [Clostridia bacterium]
MRKILTLREDKEFKNNEKLKFRILPIFAVALLLAFSIICAAADISYSDAEENVPSIDEIIEADEDIVTVNVVYGGYEYTTAKSAVVSVKEFLSGVGIELGENKALDVSEDSLIFDGQTISVGVLTTRKITEEFSIPFETVYKNSQTIPKGQVRTEKEGSYGTKTVTYEITLVNGEVISKDAVSEKITSEPVNAVCYKGIGGTVTSEDGTKYNYSYYIDVLATAYHTGGITATGHVANEEVVAVDPKVIPYGTKMFITGKWGEIGYRSAEDCGNFKGDRVDICMEGTRAELLQFGRRNMRVYILE